VTTFDRISVLENVPEVLFGRRKIPAIHLRLSLNMYTNSTARINWNSAFSQSFGIRSGVKQGGISSPVLFCIYIDRLLVRLKQSKIRCWIGNTFVGALAYADDITPGVSDSSQHVGRSGK